jgi:cobalt-zinc-cadmium efflux system protein
VHGHAHAHSHGIANGRVLTWSLAATVAFVVIEVAAGFQAGSLALISDAGHNFTDALALLLAWFGAWMQSKPADEVKTFGYQRAGVLSAFVNALTLAGVSLWIFYESYDRFLNPQPVDDRMMIWIAGLGLLLNVGIMWGLREARHHDINVRSAFLHMLGDALGSIGIIIGALVIRYTGWMRVDPILSVIIGALIVWTAWDIIRESLNILLEGLPRGLHLREVTGAMQAVDGVLGVHDLHIWSLGSQAHALSCHVVIEDLPPSESDTILRRLNKTLLDRFHIHHTTVQFEHKSCPVTGNGCVVPVGAHQHGHAH